MANNGFLDISNQLRAVMIEKGLNVAQAAHRCGVSNVRIKQLRNGFGCSEPAMRKVAWSLGMTESDFMNSG